MQKIIILLPATFTLLMCTANTERFTPQKGAITESVYASGTVMANSQYIVHSPVSGILLKINAVVGSDVKKGEILFEIENQKEHLMSQSALLTYKQGMESSHYIQDKIKELEINIESYTVKADADCSFYERCKNVSKVGAVTVADLERAAAACKGSRLDLERALKQLTQLREQLKNEQTLNNINLQIKRSAESDYLIKSAIDGTVYNVIVNEGELITQQTPLAIIGAKGAFILELEVDENDMAKIAAGQQIIVTMDSYKGKVFEATVDDIYPIIDEYSRTFKIEGHFKKSPKILYPNLPVEANIIINSKVNALIIPKSYIVDDTYVLVGKKRKRKVCTGLSDYQQVEITSGLKAGEIIYKPQ